MSLGNITYWPVLIAAIVSFAFGAIWYGGLGKQWMTARDMSAADMEKARAQAGPIPVPYIIAFVALLIMAWMFAGVLLHLARGGMPVTIRAGMISGQSRLPECQAVPDADRWRALAGRAPDPGRNPGLVGCVAGKLGVGVASAVAHRPASRHSSVRSLGIYQPTRSAMHIRRDEVRA